MQLGCCCLCCSVGSLQHSMLGIQQVTERESKRDILVVTCEDPNLHNNGNNNYITYTITLTYLTLT